TSFTADLTTFSSSGLSFTSTSARDTDVVAWTTWAQAGAPNDATDASVSAASRYFMRTPLFGLVLPCVHRCCQARSEDFGARRAPFLLARTARDAWRAASRRGMTEIRREDVQSLLGV